MYVPCPTTASYIIRRLYGTGYWYSNDIINYDYLLERPGERACHANDDAFFVQRGFEVIANFNCY